MRLYHYRSVDSAMMEIENETFFFASREELNDPLEGYVRVYWQGDKAAWEGMFRNYVCSVSQAIMMYLLGKDEDILHHYTLVEDIHKYDNVPLGTICKELGDTFLNDAGVQKLAAIYGEKKWKVQQEELKLLFRFIHNKALSLCIRSFLGHGLLQENIGTQLREFFGNQTQPIPPEDFFEKLSDEAGRKMIMKYAEDILEDLIEFHYIKDGSENKVFLYGNAANGSKETEDTRLHRNWLAITVDFPNIYVEQLKELIYPEGFAVCFSGKSNDSAMWGNYADKHKGVCVIYETDENQEIKIRLPDRMSSRKVKKVAYEGEVIERNFFESFGRLTYSQIEGWLTGSDGISSCYETFTNEDEWRNQYWAAFEAKNYRKIKAWEHEDEYRMVIDNQFYDISDPERRKLQYDISALKGIIFGINTSEYDKNRLVEKLSEKKDALKDFTFYQAEYDDVTQEIVVRKKILWNLE